MKKYFFFIFLIAFAVCAAWSIGTDKSKPAHTDFSSSAPAPSFWQEPLAPLKEKSYPYLHFHEAMEDHIKSIPMYVSIHLIPKDMRHAIVATEDRRFYEHGALDPIGIVRAIVVNFYSGSTVEGGSTISQQVVKNVFLSHERTFTRKAQEVVLAYLLEHYYTKDEILEIYLNTAYFGATPRGFTKPVKFIMISIRKNFVSPRRLCLPAWYRRRHTTIRCKTMMPPENGRKLYWH